MLEMLWHAGNLPPVDKPLGMAVHFLPASYEHRTVYWDPSSALDSKLPAGRTGSDPSPYPY